MFFYFLFIFFFTIMSYKNIADNQRIYAYRVKTTTRIQPWQNNYWPSNAAIGGGTIGYDVAKACITDPDGLTDTFILLSTGPYSVLYPALVAAGAQFVYFIPYDAMAKFPPRAWAQSFQNPEEVDDIFYGWTLIAQAA